MIVYAVTVNIDDDVHDDWLKWMKTTHIPEVMETGCFSDFRLGRVILDREIDGTNYSVQYDCESLAVLQKYTAKHAPALQKEHKERYEGKFVAFRTILELEE